MASHRLIEASITALARRLPADVTDELADGLTETYQRHLAQGLKPDAAARAAITEFGDPDLIVAAFVLQSPGRQTARTLLATGPIVGGCWAAALVTGQAWAWPLPAVVRPAFGLTLIAVITALVLAATTRRSYRRTRIAAIGSTGLIALDTAMLACIALAPPGVTGLMVLAALVSLTRIALVVRAAPRLFHS